MRLRFVFRRRRLTAPILVEPFTISDESDLDALLAALEARS